jgi:hypothetical protein
MGVVTLFRGATSTVAAPSLVTDGVPLWRGAKGFLNSNEGFPEDLDEAEIVLFETAYTSGVPAIAFARIWGGFQRDETSIIWSPLGTGTGNAAAATDKGRLNNGAAIDGPTATTLRHAEIVRSLRQCNRIALQTGAFTGVFTLEARLQAKVVR